MSDISYSKFLIKSKFNPKKAKKYMESYDKIMESGLFDKNYYLKAYPHIAKSGMDPLVHYLFYGYKEDKNPSAQFNLKRYLEEYPEIKRKGLNPLVHYIDNDHEGFTLEENPFIARRKKILDTNSLFLANYIFDSEANQPHFLFETKYTILFHFARNLWVFCTKVHGGAWDFIG